MAHKHHHWYVEKNQFDQIIGWGLEIGSKSDDGSAMFIADHKGLDLSDVITAIEQPWMNALNFPKFSNPEAQVAVEVHQTDGTIKTGWRKKE